MKRTKTRCTIDILSLNEKKNPKTLTVNVFWCPVYRETIKIKVPILWFWSKANVPTQETQHSEGSFYIGNASICAPTSSIFLSLSCVSLPCSLTLSSPLPLVFPSLPLYVLIFPFAASPSPPLFGLCLFFFAFSLHLAPTPPPLLLCIPQYPTDRESSIFIGETHVLFWQ